MLQVIGDCTKLNAYLKTIVKNDRENNINLENKVGNHLNLSSE